MAGGKCGRHHAEGAVNMHLPADGRCAEDVDEDSLVEAARRSAVDCSPAAGLFALVLPAAAEEAGFGWLTGTPTCDNRDDGGRDDAPRRTDNQQY